MSFKHLSFIDLFTKENLVVEIPMLQRDYAYGRITEREKRTEFLRSIKTYLLSDNMNHELDFIYGSISAPKGENCLVLLDGQQRITTLFLLHWYFAIVNKQFSQFREVFLFEGKSKFAYTIRESSAEFCNALVSLYKRRKNKDKNEEVDQSIDYYNYICGLSFEKLLSSKIRNERWFFSHWNNDPTVINMLNMLDDIARTFSVDESNGLFDKLNKSGINSSITFNLLPLDDYKLTDELYIKMNSRGKSLTRFENFKSKMLKKYDEQKQSQNYKKKLQEINDLENKNYASLRDYVGLMMDTKWTDVFWNFWLQGNKSVDSKPSVDDMFLSFISNICIFYEILRLMNGSLSMKRNSFEEKQIDEFMNVRNNIPYENLIAILQANDNYLLYKIIDILNLLSEKHSEKKWVLKTYFDDTVYFFNEITAFEKIVKDYESKERNYEDKVIYFGYLVYLLQNKPDKKDKNFVDWMRFVYDMCKNSYNLSNAAYTFSNCLAGINYLCSKDIYNTLPTKEISGIVTLDSYQLEEEVLKAKLFKNQKWREAITDALEKLKYFEGQIHYELIDSVGVTCKDIDDDKKIKSFLLYVNKVASIFSQNDGSPFDIDLVRALLSKGDYTTVYKSSNSLFRNGKDRDISWLRYHKKEKLEENSIDKRIYLTQVLTDIDFDDRKPKESLAKIAEKYSESIPEWRKILIKNIKDFEKEFPNTDGYKLGVDRLLRWNVANKKCSKTSKDDYEIDLISKKQITSRHAELFTYALFLNNRENEISPWGKPLYKFQQSEDAQPFMVYGALSFADEHYYLQVYYTGSKQYELRFMNWNEDDEKVNEITNFSIQDLLKMNNFEKVEQKNYYVRVVNRGTIMNDIREFCCSLNTRLK